MTGMIRSACRRHLLSRHFTNGFTSKIRTPEEEAKIMIADLTKTKELIYTGPVNSLIRRLQMTMTTSTVGVAVTGPLLLHYFTTGWPFSSQLFFTLSIGGAAIFQSWICSSLISRYVAAIYRLVPESKSLTATAETPNYPDDRLEFVTYDHFGRSKKRTFSPSQFEAESRGSWIPVDKNKSYLLFHGTAKQSDYFKQLASKLEQD